METMRLQLNEIERIVTQLIDDGLEDSADKLCTLFLSSCPSSTSTGHSAAAAGGNEEMMHSGNLYSKLFELQGDCAYKKEEYLRSLQLYRQSIQNEHNKYFYSINSKEIAQIHYKISQCYLKANDKSAAIRELEIIPKDFRTTKINVTLAKLYYSSELNLSANSVLKQVIKSSPLALECMEMLVNLGADVTEFLPKTKSRQANVEMNDLCQDWISSIITSLSCHRLSQYQEARNTLEPLLQAFPNSAYLHTIAANCSYDREDIDQSLYHFRQIRRHDPKQISGMDKFGLLLYSQSLNLLSMPSVTSAEQCLISLPRVSGDVTRIGIDVSAYRDELCHLATEMMFDYPRNPIAWSCAALYSDLKGEREKSMQFINMACSKLEPALPMSFNIKGVLFLVRDTPDQAADAFSQGNKLEKNVDSFAGLAECSFHLGKNNEVLENIRQALKIRPSSSRCFTLIGRALAKGNSASSRKDAIKGYRKAIRLNSSNLYAVLELADILCAEGQHQEAADILLAAIEKYPAYLLRCYYGKVLGQLKQYQKAILELHLAMSSCPSGSDVSLAIQEVDRIEGLLQGQEFSMSNESYDPSLQSRSSSL